MEQNNEEIDKEDLGTLYPAVSDLFSNYNTEYGSIKKFKRGGTLIIMATTGGWSNNEEVVSKFNGTQFYGAPIRQWFLTYWTQGGNYKWTIPLYLVEKLDTKEVGKTSKKILRCSFCGIKVVACDQCKKEFKVENDLICLMEERHFCSKKCLKEFLKEQALSTTTFLDDE